MGPEFAYGDRLTDDEYERRVIELQRGAPAMPTRAQDRALRRRALDLAIDHRLGRAFPADRREALWQAAERVEARRLRLGLRFLLQGLVRGTRASHGAALARALEREYGQVLSREELERFLGLPREGDPAPPEARGDDPAPLA